MVQVPRLDTVTFNATINVGDTGGVGGGTLGREWGYFAMVCSLFQAVYIYIYGYMLL